MFSAAGFEPNPGFEEAAAAAVAAGPFDEPPPLAACLNANDFEAVARKFMPVSVAISLPAPNRNFAGASCALCTAESRRATLLWSVCQHQRGKSACADW